MDVDGAGPVAERDARGLSRRQLIEASAAAGAAAWTAPLIVESLTSPAAAFSGDCKQYTVKLTASGACFSACFGGVLGTCFPASGSKWGRNCSAPTCSNVCGDNPATGPAAGTTTRMPSVASDGDFYQVTYPSNCEPATVARLADRRSLTGRATRAPRTSGSPAPRAPAGAATGASTRMPTPRRSAR